MAEAVDMSKHFTMKELLKFAAPSIVMMVFTSIYYLVDGFFVSNFAGETSFAAVNFIMPVIMILSTVGFMVGTGGSALISKARGEGNDESANRIFSLLVYFAAALGLILAIAGVFLARPIATLMGATGEMLDLATVYARVSMISLTFYILQVTFQAFFVTAGKPGLGLKITVVAGCMNIVLDALFVGFFGWGVVGAAAATAITETFGGLFPIVYFARENSSFLRLGKTSINWKVIGKTCTNGSSEMMTNIATSLVALLYNYQLLHYLGENGVAAYGVLENFGFIFVAVLMGFSIGVAPLMSFQYGSQNRTEIRSLFKKSMTFMFVCGIVLFALAELTAPIAAFIYASYSQDLMNLIIHAIRLYAFAMIFMGISIYGSSLFTSLSNGLVSALISFLRTLLFESSAVFLLPLILGNDGIWLSCPAAEIISATLTISFIIALGPRYGFINRRNTKNATIVK